MTATQTENTADLVTRKLRLKALDPAGQAALKAELDVQPSVREVECTPTRVKVTYGAMHCGIDEILKHIRAAGAEPVENWWTLMKLGFYRTTEQNIRENSTYEPHCCSKPPKGR